MGFEWTVIVVHSSCCQMLDDLKISYYHVSHCISHQVNHKKRSALSVLFAITYPFNIKMDHLSLLISEVGMTCMNLNISVHIRLVNHVANA